MREICLSGDALSSPSSALPASDNPEDLHVTLTANRTLKLDASLWNILFTDPRLRCLSLIDLQLYQSDARILVEHLHTQTHLVELTLQSVLQSEFVFDAILNQGLQANTSIETLTISNLGKVDASTIASLIKHNSTIKYLFLPHNHISPTGATLIADAFRKNTSIISLDISHNDIGNDGALAFMDILLQASSRLTQINFSENGIDNETRQKFVRCSKAINIIYSSETEPLLVKEPVNVAEPPNVKEQLNLEVPSVPRNKFQFLSTILVTFLFFLWGVPNQLNDVLIRQFSKAFTLSRFEAGLVQSAFYMGYFLWSLPAAYVLRRWGYKVGLVIGLLLFGTGSFLFWPAALIGEYVPFLVSLFIIATGLAFLETAANPFIAQAAGPADSSAKRLNIAQAFNPLGAITGALVGTLFIFSGIELNEKQIEQLRSNHTYDAYLKHETVRVVQPYVVLGGITFLWAILIALVPFPVHTKATRNEEAETSDGDTNMCRPLFLFSIVAQFVYVGAQVGTWSYFMQYAQDYVHIKEKMSGYLLTGTLGMFAIGRLTAALLMHFGLSPSILLASFAFINVLLTVITVLVPNSVGLATLFFTSFFMSLMFPTIFALGIKGLSAHTTKLASCLLVMAIVGGAVFTPLMGLIAEKTKSLALAYILPGGAYLIIAVYGLLAYAVTEKRTNVA